MKEEFISANVEQAILNYISNSSLDNRKVSFIVLKMLTIIYSEEGVVTPFKNNNMEAFKNNICKYGLSPNMYKEFIKHFKKICEFVNDNNEEFKAAFTNIIKDLIIMFTTKAKNNLVSSEVETEFMNYINDEEYNPYLKVFKRVEKEDLLTYYFDKKDKHCPAKDLLLNVEAYEKLNYSLTDIANMSDEELNEVNKKVYAHFNIDANDINAKYLLNEALKEKKVKSELTTGNGYVDILVIAAIVGTILMILIIIGILVF